ncbi:MAG: glycoside hydrolase family 5 protein, partial [Saccharofermentans sp.]|nr:glycoside hydrolase family 5 protein [Saccharofermentans sp.]
FIASVVTMGTISMVMPAKVVYADPSAVVESTNPWETGGQITLNLSGCEGYGTITVVVEFEGTVKSASGWGFDSYTVNGNQVTAVVTSDGPNNWGFNGNVGIQVEGSNITGAKLVSIEGSGTGNAGSNNNNNNTQNTTAATTAVSGDPVTPSVTVHGVEGDDWLTTNGDKILDMNGNEVWITGLSWFGYNTGSNLFDGVWGCNLDDALKAIADHGFNLIRVPISAELLLQWSRGEYPEANYNHAYNANLEGMNSLEIWEHVLDVCEDNGIKIMLDIHSAQTDAMGHMLPMWYSGDISVDDYYEALDWVSARYANNDTIVAYDIKNEPHGKASEPEHAIWNDSTDSNNWKYIAENAGNIILDNNPNALIVIEGIQIYPIDISSNNFTSTNDDDYYNSWWGGNLRGVADYPIDFGSEARNRQVVYSPHDYGPAVYAQPWFDGGFTYESLIDDYWYDSWLYIDDQSIAPLLIGEWGGFMTGDNLTWMTYMRQLIGEYHLNHTFWCFNANSGDTGGLVLDDFTTWDEEKYSFVSEVLWQTSEGQFIGLDHEVPLGNNGIALKDYTGDEITPVVHDDTTKPVQAEVSETTVKADESAQVEENTEAGVPVEKKGPSTLKIVLGVVGGIFGAAILTAGGILVYKLGYKIGKGKEEQNG